MITLRFDFRQSLVAEGDLFDTILSLKGRVIRQREGRRTVFFKLAGQSYVAKIHHGVGWKEIGKNLLQLRWPVVSAKNEWQALAQLAQLGVTTPVPVAYGIRGGNPARLQSFVITEALQNTVTLEEFCRSWHHYPPCHGVSLRLKRLLIRKIAQIARRLHSNGINHRDFYLCHFRLQLPLEPNDSLERIDPHLYLMDLHRAQIRRRTPRRWIIKDIGSLYFSAMDIRLTQRDLMRFMMCYHGQSLKKMRQEEALFWKAVQQRARRLYRKIHGKEPPIKIYPFQSKYPFSP
jgi:heptose I phosphotransferase